jgi:hypothetical protein
MKYKVLTLTPPWGTLVAIGAKKIEARGWPTNYRGPLLIHQGSNLRPVGGEQGLIDICASEPFRSVLFDAGYTHWGNLDKGAIVAVCELVDVRPIPASLPVLFGYVNAERAWDWRLADQERAFGDYSPGRFAWLLADVRALPEPITARGMPGLWEWEGELKI